MSRSGVGQGSEAKRERLSAGSQGGSGAGGSSPGATRRSVAVEQEKGFQGGEGDVMIEILDSPADKS